MTPILRFALGEAYVTLINTGTGRWIASDSLRIPPNGWPEDAAAFVGQRYPVPFQSVHVALGATSLVIDPMDFREYLSLLGGQVAAGYDVPRLDQQLAAIGVGSEQVTAVAVTHAHDDHYVMVTVEEEGQRVPLFPHAPVFAHRADWTPEGQALIFQSLPAVEQLPGVSERYMGAIIQQHLLHLLNDDTEIAPGIQLLHTPGETPGHLVVRVQSRGQTLYYLGDLIHHQVEVQHFDWTPTWADPEPLLRSRQRIFAAALQEDALLIASHIPGVGRLRPTEAGLVWETVPFAATPQEASA